MHIARSLRSSTCHRRQSPLRSPLPSPSPSPALSSRSLLSLGRSSVAWARASPLLLVDGLARLRVHQRPAGVSKNAPLIVRPLAMHRASPSPPNQVAYCFWTWPTTWRRAWNSRNVSRLVGHITPLSRKPHQPATTTTNHLPRLPHVAAVGGGISPDLRGRRVAER